MDTDRDPAAENALGGFLRARRARLRPEDVGIPASGRRRVPGLRREEIATLAGVSTDYYMRLEQGRERHPSQQILEAVAPLGDFLRARREALKPQDVGLPEHGRRRVPGLCREEVAMLAGVSSDYYMRLEQGRETSPSPQVIDAIAAALRLDDEAHDHLRRLTQAPRRRSVPAGHDKISPSFCS